MLGKNSWSWFLLLLQVFCVCAAAQQNSPVKIEPRLESGAGDEHQIKAKRIAENNLKVQSLMTEGINAFQNRKFDISIEKFDEALKFEPEYWGISTVILTNKAMVLRTVGIKKYNEAAKNYWNVAAEANPYFTEAVIALNRALQIFTDTPAEIAESNKASFELYKFNTIKELTECYRLLVLTDKAKTDEAIKAFEDYILLETDELKKDKAVSVLKKLKVKDNY